MQILIPALLSALFLAGCALPPVITLASLAASGASYATTGKSTSDHAISAVVGEDCALHRIFGDEAVCDPNGEVLIVLVGAKTADEDWYLDPESGLSASPELAPPNQASLPEATAVPVPKHDDNIAALKPAPPSHGKNRVPLENLIALAAAPPPRGFFADARPAPKPDAPQLQEPQAPDASTQWYSRLTEKTRDIFKTSAPH